MPKPHLIRVGLLRAGMALCLCLVMPAGAEQPAAEPEAVATEVDPALSDSETLARASRSLLLDLARFRDGYAAVGERGHILISGDGETWQQVTAPTRSTLTSVAARGDQLWAVGHDGVILHSKDGGGHWTRRRAVPRTGESDEPDHGAPLLDLLVLNDKTAIAVGAYSLMLVSRDGGVTWKRHRALDVAADTSCSHHA